MSGTQPWPALVLPDVCFDEVISNAELWDRSFAFIRGSSEKQSREDTALHASLVLSGSLIL